MSTGEDFEVQAKDLISEIMKRPEQHMHSTREELNRCCTLGGIMMLDVKDAHGDIGCPATL